MRERWESTGFLDDSTCVLPCTLTRSCLSVIKGENRAVVIDRRGAKLVEFFIPPIPVGSRLRKLTIWVGNSSQRMRTLSAIFPARKQQ